MRFLMLMWSDVDAAGGDQSDIDAWASFDAEARKAGVRVDGGALQPAASHARLVRPEITGIDSSDAVQERPFIDGPAQVQAYYLLNCPDLTDALTWARKLPTYGTVEVRQLLEYDLG